MTHLTLPLPDHTALTGGKWYWRPTFNHTLVSNGQSHLFPTANHTCLKQQSRQSPTINHTRFQQPITPISNSQSHLFPTANHICFQHIQSHLFPTANHTCFQHSQSHLFPTANYTIHMFPTANHTCVQHSQKHLFPTVNHTCFQQPITLLFYSRVTHNGCHVSMVTKLLLFLKNSPVPIATQIIVYIFRFPGMFTEFFFKHCNVSNPFLGISINLNLICWNSNQSMFNERLSYHLNNWLKKQTK